MDIDTVAIVAQRPQFARRHARRRPHFSSTALSMMLHAAPKEQPALHY